MVVLITGASHTGKTLLAQKLMETYRYPCFSIDHLKMGLIRSGHTALTPTSGDAALTAYLWPIVREMIKTALENAQNLIVEGCYIPFDWQKDFTPAQLAQMRYICLVMSERYIRTHFADICRYANVIEKRLDDSACTLQALCEDNAAVLQGCRAHGLRCCLIDTVYPADIPL